MNIFELRKRIGYTQKKMARLICVSTPTYKLIEEGRSLTEPQIAILEKIGATDLIDCDYEKVKNNADTIIGVSRDMPLKTWAERYGVNYQTAVRKAAEQCISGKQLIPGLRRNLSGRYFVNINEYERTKIQERV